MRTIFRAALIGVALAIAIAASVALASPVSAERAPLPECAQEDSPGPCYWDASKRGNGKGRSFWVDRNQRVHYLTIDVCQAQHRRSHKAHCSRFYRAGTLSTVPRRTARAITEGRTSRCMWRLESDDNTPQHDSTTYTFCADGRRYAS